MLPELTGDAKDDTNKGDTKIINFRDELIKRGRGSRGTGEYYDAVDEKGTATGDERAEFRQRIENLEGAVVVLQKISQEGKALPENIYKMIDDVKFEGVKSENIILKVRELLRDGLKNLEQAFRSIDEEIERESEIDLFFDKVRRISFFSSKNSNFEDAVTSVLIALQGNVANGYSREKILALKDITGLLLDNIFMSEEILDRCIYMLEKVGFDLSYPFRGVDFNEPI
jgi:hypothetical protein